MEIKVDFDKYAKNQLKSMQKELKAAKNENEKESLKNDIKMHKEKYSI